MNQEKRLLNIYFGFTFLCDFTLFIIIKVLKEIGIGIEWETVTIALWRMCIVMFPCIYIFKINVKHLLISNKREITLWQKTVFIICFWSLYRMFCFFVINLTTSEESIQVMTSSYHPVSLFGFIILAPIIEEIIDRGIVLKQLQSHGKWLAIIISSLTFALPHYKSWPITFVAGLLLGILYTETEDLKACIVLHSLINGFSVLEVLYIGGVTENLIFFVIVFAISLILVLITKKCREIISNYSIKGFIDDFKKKKGDYKTIFSSELFLLYIIFILINTI